MVGETLKTMPEAHPEQDWLSKVSAVITDESEAQVSLFKPLLPRIKTDDVSIARKRFKDRTNLVSTRENGLPLAPLVTYSPNACLTFGGPNSTTTLNQQRHQTQYAAMRALRYTAAEKALVTSLQRSTRAPSHVNLQIRILKQATARLALCAEEARENAFRLRELLISRDTEPRVFRQLQRDRWRQEKQYNKADEDAKALSASLQALRDTGTILLPSNSHLPRETELSYRKRHNLQTFLVRPVAPVINCLRRSTTYGAASQGIFPVTSPPPPTRLRRLHLVSLLSRTGSSSPESGKTAELEQSSMASLRCTFGLKGMSPGSQICAGGADEDLFHDQSSSPVLSVVADVLSVQPDSSRPRMAVAFGTPLNKDRSSLISVDGIATIYPSIISTRSPDEILAEARLEDVEIPTYALDLLDNLDPMGFILTFHDNKVAIISMPNLSSVEFTMPQRLSSDSFVSSLRPSAVARHSRTRSRLFKTLFSKPSRLWSHKKASSAVGHTPVSETPSTPTRSPSSAYFRSSSGSSYAPSPAMNRPPGGSPGHRRWRSTHASSSGNGNLISRLKRSFSFLSHRKLLEE